ncbi:MAG: cytochrome P450, partial [Anaerolineales bacterium]|nr:cytochrome P450 [Anaerolineales bacterium]
SGMQTWLKLLANPLTLLFPYDWPLTPYRRFVDLSLWLDEQIRVVIARKRQQGAEDSGDVLSMLLHAADDAGDRLSEDELIGHANVLFVAGHETSSNALTWTLFLLAQHPEVMTAVYEELTDTLHGEAPTIVQLEELNLLDRVIKESMRILPPVPASGRLVVQDTELGGYPIERGHEVLFSHYHTHHDPQIYEVPERFDPDRWLTITPTAHEYMPFSAGRRMCIGSAFAQMEIKIVLAMVLQRYRLQLQPQLKVDPLAGITMGPQNGLPMIVRPQDQRFAENRTAVRGKILACVEM